MSETLKEAERNEAGRDEVEQQKKEVMPPEKLAQPTHRRKPSPCVEDWDFWRFVLAALSLAWEIIKTFVR